MNITRAAILSMGISICFLKPCLAQDPGTASLKEAAGHLMVGTPTSYQNLAIYPITVASINDSTRYYSQDKVMAKNMIRITEQGSASVPTLKLSNKSKNKIFIMTGEIITGAKQDRMSAQDILLGPHKKNIAMKVYCVESGRWVHQSRQFAAGGTAGTKKLRMSATNKASQSEIWSNVAEKSRDSDVRSSTGTMQAVYQDPKIRKKIAAYQQAFSKLPQNTKNMVGFITVIKGPISSADVFANPKLMSDLWKKLMKAAAVDAVTSKEASQNNPSLEVAQQFLKDGLSGTFKPIENPGLGREYLLEGQNGITGSSLVHQSSIIHLALFSPEKGDRPRELRPDLRNRNRIPSQQESSGNRTQGRYHKKTNSKKSRIQSKQSKTF